METIVVSIERFFMGAREIEEIEIIERRKSCFYSYFIKVHNTIIEFIYMINLSIYFSFNKLSLLNIYIYIYIYSDL